MNFSNKEGLYFIAEAGVNHNGDINIAKKLIDIASDAGADAVKFQTFKTHAIITREAPKATYHVETTGADAKQTWYKLLESQELDRSDHEILIDYCCKKNIDFLSTPYDLESADLLRDMGIKAYKIASTDANNVPLLRHIAGFGKPVILSTAMCNYTEIEASVDLLLNSGTKDLVLMHCTGSYPAPLEDGNLLAIKTLRERLNIPLGFSDHHEGFVSGIMAVALGACVYERHFTLDKGLPGPDHRASLDPYELNQQIKLMREAELLMGNGIKRVMPCETENRKKLRKHIVANARINKGDLLTIDNITTKRTGGIGLEANMWDEVIDKPCNYSLLPDQPLLSI